MSTPLSHRQILIDLLRSIESQFDPLIAAEIGVAVGGTSEALLRAFPRLTLLMVDPWTVYYPTRRTQHDYDCQFAEARKRVEFAGGRAQVWRSESVDVARWAVNNESLALAFIDGDHRYHFVQSDLNAWWPKVAPGGLLTGHDYNSPKNQTGAWGVKQAVDEWEQRSGVKVEHHGTVWVARKPKG